jgi:hypothetical protein
VQFGCVARSFCAFSTYEILYLKLLTINDI